MKTWGGIGAAAAAIAVLAYASAASAQTPSVGQGPAAAAGSQGGAPERIGVFDEARPDYDALGVRLGSFVAFPSINLSETYDSNVFATPSNTKSDFYTTLSPALAIQSDWGVHALSFTTSGQIKRYASEVSENVSNFATDLGGRLDITDSDHLFGDIGYQLQHEDRSSPDAVNGKRPVEYHVTGGNLAYVHDVTRIGLRVDSSITSYDYNNATSSTGATIIENDRDRIEYVIAPRVSYEIIPGYQAFARALGNERQYASQRDASGFERSSHGYEIDAGTALQLTHIINGEVYVGYLDQEYEDARFKPTSGLSFGGNLLWNVTPLTSVRASLSRSVVETSNTLDPASGSLESAATLRLEHELLRNVLVAVGADYVHDDYQGITRTDDTYGANATVRYLMRRGWSSGLDLSYKKRSSNAVGGDFDRLIGMVDLKVGF